MAGVRPTAGEVTTSRRLELHGWTRGAVRAQLDARRWQRCGRALVLHNGPLHPDEMAEVALLNCGPRAALTAFTLAAERGLSGWKGEAIDVLVPGGARVCRPPGLRLRIHWVGDWSKQEVRAGRHALAPALIVAAATFTKPRPACGLLAAGVQQRLVAADQLRQAVDANPRTHHRTPMLLALSDIAQGSEALSEIDFVRLCRRHGLPEPVRQAVRSEPSGRRRYLDAEWVTSSGQRIVVEVDGALHLAPRKWWDDQLRQNELALTRHVVLRFPSVIIRHEERLVVDQLRRGLRL
jgi:hypothetical protein